MDVSWVKERFINTDNKTKIVLFLGILLLAFALPKEMILPLGVLAVIGLFFENIWNGFLHIFMTIFRFIVGLALVLLTLYGVLLLTVYFFA